jgi:DNA repair protein RadC
MRFHSTARDALPTPSHERPRERMMLYGRSALSDAELIALVLGRGHAMPRAATLLHCFGGLLGLDGACAEELRRVAGVGDAAATALSAAFELGRRAAQAGLPYASPLRTPSDVSAYVRARIGAEEREEFLVLGLDARQRVRLVRQIAVGSLAQVDVHPREVFRPLVRSGMHSVILVHNHPSGDVEPSDADLELTRRLADVGRLVGIPVLDHLIVTRTDAISMATLGLLA